MRLMIDVQMDYALQAADPALLAIAAAWTQDQCVIHSTLDAGSASLRWIDGEGGIGQRVWAIAPDGRLQLRYRAEVEITRPDIALDGTAATEWDQVPAEVLTYLRPSRYCPSDMFISFVEREFGHLQGGARVAAMRDWIADALIYMPGSSGSATTALETFVQRQGVCRDYAHLMCCFARAANIPARYTTGYGADVNPPDFHAVAEIWLDGAWHIVDPTGMSTASSLAIIGSGRDAGDVAVMETEKAANFQYQAITVSRM